MVYSDGSLSSEGAASYGFTIHQNNVPIFDGSGRLRPAEVFDAEATGALEGLRAALDLRESVTENIFICLDNLAPRAYEGHHPTPHKASFSSSKR
jgi:hypothetical protein